MRRREPEEFLGSHSEYRLGAAHVLGRIGKASLHSGMWRQTEKVETKFAYVPSIPEMRLSVLVYDLRDDADNDPYPRNPRTALGSKCDAPGWLEGLKVFVRLEESLDRERVDDAENQQGNKDERLGPAAICLLNLRTWHITGAQNSNTLEGLWKSLGTSVSSKKTGIREEKTFMNAECTRAEL